MIGARLEPPSLWILQARQRDLERERLRRCLSLTEEMELARLRGQIERMTALPFPVIYSDAVPEGKIWLVTDNNLAKAAARAAEVV